MPQTPALAWFFALLRCPPGDARDFLVAGYRCAFYEERARTLIPGGQP